MALQHGIRIAVNGSETDVDVENDSASWLSKLANVRTTMGGGSNSQGADLTVLSVDALVPVRYAHLIRTITVAVTGKFNTADNSGAGAGDVWSGSGSAQSVYRIIFHGDVVSARAQPGREPTIQLDALDQLSGVLQRRAQCSASNGSGIEGVLDAVKAAHSLSMAATDGSEQFPQAAYWQALDRPYQKDQTNGAYIQEALNGSRINLVAEWQGTITAPELTWRPDYFFGHYDDSNVSSTFWNWANIPHPWLLTYPDAGIQFGDYVAQYQVDGHNGGASYYGRAWLNVTAERLALGQRVTRLQSWINTAAGCKAAAARLIGAQGEPNKLMLKRVGYYPEQLYAAAVADPDWSNTNLRHANSYAWCLARMLPGDTVFPRDPFGNSYPDAQDWPASFPQNSLAYDDLNQLWNPVIKNGSSTDTTVGIFARTVEHRFHPVDGWYVELGLDYVGAPTVPAGDTDSGTYT